MGPQSILSKHRSSYDSSVRSWIIVIFQQSGLKKVDAFQNDSPSRKTNSVDPRNTSITETDSDKNKT